MITDFILRILDGIFILWVRIIDALEVIVERQSITKQIQNRDLPSRSIEL